MDVDQQALGDGALANCGQCSTAQIERMRTNAPLVISDPFTDRQISGGSIVASRLLRSPGSFRGLKPTATVKSSLRDVQRSSPFTNNLGMHRVAAGRFNLNLGGD